MGTKASIHVTEVSVNRMPANADIFLDLRCHILLLSHGQIGECNVNSSEFTFCCFPTTPWVYKNTAELKWFHILKSSSTTPSPPPPIKCTARVPPVGTSQLVTDVVS